MPSICILHEGQFIWSRYSLSTRKWPHYEQRWRITIISLRRSKNQNWILMYYGTLWQIHSIFGLKNLICFDHRLHWVIQKIGCIFCVAQTYIQNSLKFDRLILLKGNDHHEKYVKVLEGTSQRLKRENFKNILQSGIWWTIHEVILPAQIGRSHYLISIIGHCIVWSLFF